MDGMISDIRHEIFRECLGARVTAVLTAEADGVLSGIERAHRLTEEIGLEFSSCLADGHLFQAGEVIARVIGNPVQIAMAEERIIGTLSKSSGIATAARKALRKIGPGRKVVSGGWKKMPFEIKKLVRKAAQDGGVDARISNVPFVYLDKNFVRVLGGVAKAVRGVLHLGRSVVVQIRGETKPIRDEGIDAAEAGASVIMVDTGEIAHLSQVSSALKAKGLRSRVRLAFAGNLTLERMERLSGMDLDIVDIGYAILDAPCLPMKFDVIELNSKELHESGIPPSRENRTLDQAGGARRC
jgi:nicotinate-nucleotide pyrophosphorylase (carboxylating)